MTGTNSGKRRYARHLSCIAVAALSLLVFQPVASAAAPCANQVCLYDSDGGLVGSYRDTSSSWQYFNRIRTAYAKNGFSDYSVYFKNRSGTTGCIQPMREATIGQDDPAVALMIVRNGNCYPGGKIETGS